MPTRALSAPSVDRTVGGLWDIVVDVRDADGYLVDDAPVVTVTLPGGSTATPAVETVTTGVYRTEYLLAASGRYTAVAASSTNGSVALAAYVRSVATAADMPDVAAVRGYSDDDLSNWDDSQVQEALDAEADAQRAICRVGAVYPADLRNALLRRAVRNLAMRQYVASMQAGDGGEGPTYLPGNDPEVRRLERPWRKLVFG